MTALVATRSEHKLREIRRILPADSCLDLVSLSEVGVPESAEEVEIESFDTFRANALAKARYFASRSGMLTLADDSGLCVDALGGRPGVRSKRLAGRTGLAGATLDAENNRTLLSLLEGMSPDQRTARYVCAAAARFPDGRELVFEGSCAGQILDAERGHGGFGYDPLFLVLSLGRTFGELPPETKDGISHRAQAFAALGSALCRGGIDDDPRQV